MIQSGLEQRERIVIRGDTFVPYIDAPAIQQRVKELAEEIRRDLDGSSAIFVCVLDGAFMFFADLVRHIGLDCEIDFIKLSSYGEGKISSGEVRLIEALNCDVQGRHILIVEDIVDTGASIDYMKKLIAEKNPASVKIVTLLHKPTSAQYDNHLDYVGFEIPPRFVVGYGLDYAQQARSLPAIYILEDGSSSQE